MCVSMYLKGPFLSFEKLVGLFKTGFTHTMQELTEYVINNVVFFFWILYDILADSSNTHNNILRGIGTHTYTNTRTCFQYTYLHDDNIPTQGRTLNTNRTHNIILCLLSL